MLYAMCWLPWAEEELLQHPKEKKIIFPHAFANKNKKKNMKRSGLFLFFESKLFFLLIRVCVFFFARGQVFQEMADLMSLGSCREGGVSSRRVSESSGSEKQSRCSSSDVSCWSEKTW